MNAPRSAADLVGRYVVVDVPATTANLGAGFDALAMALDLATQIEVRCLPATTEPDVHVEVRGEGQGQLPSDRRNRFISALLDGIAAAGIDPALRAETLDVDDWARLAAAPAPDPNR